MTLNECLRVSPCACDGGLIQAASSPSPPNFFLLCFWASAASRFMCDHDGSPRPSVGDSGLGRWLGCKPIMSYSFGNGINHAAEPLVCPIGVWSQTGTCSGPLSQRRSAALCSDQQKDEWLHFILSLSLLAAASTLITGADCTFNDISSVLLLQHLP